jgi:HK97 family phage prohead protease
MTDRLSPLLVFKSASIAPSGIFSGFAATFNGPPDSYGDIIAPYAFSDSLADHAKKGTTPAMLWQHDQAEPVGKWTALNETAKGLEVAGKLTLGTRRGAEAYALMKDDALSLSIGYRIPKDGAAYSGNGTTTLKRIDLLEVSIVALPANSAAKITSVKSIRPDNIRDLETRLREELGFSAREAKCIASKGWAALAGDQQETELKQVAELLNAAAAQFK